jgi:V-type H+-transporting ATPase subunit E
VAFIKQEALEKAREIRVKADEEFAIEKVPLIGFLPMMFLNTMT